VYFEVFEQISIRHYVPYSISIEQQKLYDIFNGKTVRKIKCQLRDVSMREQGEQCIYYYRRCRDICCHATTYWFKDNNFLDNYVIAVSYEEEKK